MLIILALQLRQRHREVMYKQLNLTMAELTLNLSRLTLHQI